MSSARFWYVPLKQLVREQAPIAPVLAVDVVDESMLAEWAPQKLQARGIAQGDLLALMEGTEARGVARVISITQHSVKWRALPLNQGPDLTSAPNLAEVPSIEAAEFRFAIETLLRDVAVTVSPTNGGSLKAYTPTGPASNIILYGPPGTGKTHSVRRRALELIGIATLGGKPLSDASFDHISTEWERLRQEGQIVFCTFHQALAYEDFIEGLRASTDEKGTVQYSVEPGIFKRIALAATSDAMAAHANDFDTLWSVLTASIAAEPRVRKSATGKLFQLEVSARDSIHCWSGKLGEDGEFLKDEDTYRLIASRDNMRKAWDLRGELGETPSTSDFSTHVKGHITAFWLVYRELQQAVLPKSAEQRHYVLVIDEINRANIARVFGELITLLEPDKRLGSPNELRVQLPSSKEWFGVPPNLHVVGTMNTADRSIALMDVALRRRFTFEEMMPDVAVLSAELPESEVKELTIKVFEKLNERLRYLYDREHQMGHAYFFGVRSLDGLRAVFADRILPLLQEYFYGQWDKVALALGYPIKADGTPKEVRGTEHGSGTFLTTQKLDEKSVLGFDHDEYVDQVAWDVHPAFRPRGKAADAWLKQAFDELVGAKGT